MTTEEREEIIKMPIELNLLERIKNIQSEPMKKKEAKDLSILALKEKLDTLYED